MGTLVLGAAPVAPVRFRHASGDDEEGCLACWFDQEEQGVPVDAIRPCRQAEDDPREPGLCGLCSHTTAPAVAPVALSCGDCENAACRCAA